MLHSKTTIALVFLVEGALSAATNANATIIDDTTMTLVATVDTLGTYDNAGLDYYNGQPLSATNYPSAYEDQLSAKWNFYVNPVSTNQLFIVASDVRDSNFGYLYGSPFGLVALTGFDYSLPVHGNTAQPSFSSQYAVSNELLVNGGPNGSNIPLSTTPGWSVASISGPPGNLNYSITATDNNYAFTHFTSVYGATRILGGGVFELTYSPTVDLLTQADFKNLTANASNGEGSYIEQGTLNFAYSKPPPIDYTYTISGKGIFTRWTDPLAITAIDDGGTAIFNNPINNIGYGNLRDLSPGYPGLGGIGLAVGPSNTYEDFDYTGKLANGTVGPATLFTAPTRSISSSDRPADGTDAYFLAGAYQLTGPDGDYTLTISAGVPEPSTWAMMLLGLAGVGFAACARSSRERAATPAAAA